MALVVLSNIILSHTWSVVSLFAQINTHFLLQLTNHWIVMLTFLHHTDPTLPHYRNKEWTWLRGAIATVDRPLLGFLGRFFLHNVCSELCLSFYPSKLISDTGLS